MKTESQVRALWPVLITRMWVETRKRAVKVNANGPPRSHLSPPRIWVDYSYGMCPKNFPDGLYILRDYQFRWHCDAIL